MFQLVKILYGRYQSGILKCALHQSRTTQLQTANGGVVNVVQWLLTFTVVKCVLTSSCSGRSHCCCRKTRNTYAPSVDDDLLKWGTAGLCPQAAATRKLNWLFDCLRNICAGRRPPTTRGNKWCEDCRNRETARLSLWERTICAGPEW